MTKICNCASITCHTCVCSQNVNFSTTLQIHTCMVWVALLLHLCYPTPLLVAKFPSPAPQLAWLCNVCDTGVFCCRWTNKFWRNLVLTGCDQVMQYHIPEDQNPQLCYYEASELTKKCVLREPRSSPSPHEPSMTFYTGTCQQVLCMHLLSLWSIIHFIHIINPGCHGW